MKKYLACCLIILTQITSCVSKRVEDGALLNAFIVNHAIADKNVLSFQAFNEVDWDKMYIIPPYAYQKQFDQNLLKYQHDIERTGIGSMDSFCVIALFKGDQLNCIAKVSMKYNFNDAAKLVDNKFRFYLKKDAVFAATYDGNHYHFKHK